MENESEVANSLPEFVQKIVNVLTEKFTDLSFDFVYDIPPNTVDNEIIHKKIEKLEPIGTLIVGECVVPTNNFMGVFKKLFLRSEKPLYRRDAWIYSDTKVKQLFFATNNQYISMIVCPRKEIVYLKNNLNDVSFQAHRPSGGFELDDV